MGGGIFCHDGNACIIYNTISGNSATVGGGILCYDYGCNPIIRSTTIFRNSTSGMGGGVYNWGQASPTLVNCILWRNCPDQFYSYQGSPQVMYSDIMHGYVGTGNINVYPAFIDTTHNDFRLQWGSPCIDAGDPNPIYNDPDSTRADMGAWYYDQSMPVRILLTPYNQPIQIPATGGSFQYAIQATNIATATLIVPIWCDVTLPSGGVYGPVQGPLNSSLNSGQTISRIRTQAVPASAPPGVYHYNAYAVTAGDTSFDSFTFIKLGAGGWGPEAGNWTNTGEDFGSEAITQNEDNHPSSFILHPCYPNPFNSSVAISFQLLAASEVELKIYDISGREVAALGTGRWALGEHSVVWDANGMPSGIYFVRLTANSVQKVVLMK
jgi:hypothetical protein